MKVDKVIKLVNPEVGKVLYLTNDYAVQICVIIDAETKQDLIVYGIINVTTGVREAELRGYGHAVTWADKMQETVNKLAAEAAGTDELAAAMEEVPLLDKDREDEVVIDDTPTMSAEEAHDILNAMPSKED